MAKGEEIAEAAPDVPEVPFDGRDRPAYDFAQLDERLRWVVDTGRVESSRSWCVDAKVSPGLIATYLSRLRKARDPEWTREETERAKETSEPRVWPRPEPTIKVEQLEKLAAAANVDPSWLVFGHGSPPSPRNEEERAALHRRAMEVRFRDAKGAKERGYDLSADLVEKMVEVLRSKHASIAVVIEKYQRVGTPLDLIHRAIAAAYLEQELPARWLSASIKVEALALIKRLEAEARTDDSEDEPDPA